MDLDEKFFQSMKPELGSYLQTDEKDAVAPEFSVKRYHELEYLASGGMKKVTKVEDNKTGRLLAKATLTGEASSDVKEIFNREARLMAQLAHPNIVSVHDLGEGEEGPWFTMDLLEGDSLRDAFTSKSIIERLGIFLKVCDAIEYAHSKEIIHLDIKPDNVLIGNFGEVLLCDWGVAKVLHESEKSYEINVENNKTLHGEIKGSPGYMAPEQAAGDVNKIGPATDIYSLGATLYCMLTGNSAIKGTDLGSIISDTISGNFESPRSVNPFTPKALEAICLKAMATKGA